MGPHLIWAFVVLCGFALVAWMWRRTEEEGEQREKLARAHSRASVLETEWEESLAREKALGERVTALEADLKPIKAKHSAGQFGAIGGGR